MPEKQNPATPDRRFLKKKTRIPFKVLLSVIIFLLALELVLQAAHLFTGMMTRSGQVEAGGPVILCLGDSHTYGLYVPKEKSYPARLQSLLQKEGTDAEVINRGIPGQNSSQLRRRLPELMQRYEPDIVIVFISANNDWNKSATLWSDLLDGAVDSGLKSSFLKIGYKIYDALRTPKLVMYLVYENMSAKKARVMDRDGRIHFHRGRLKDQDWDTSENIVDRGLRDLLAVIDTIREHGAQPLLLNYPAQPAKPREMENYVIKRASRIRSVPLVNIRDAITPRFWIPGKKFDRSARNKYFLDDPEEAHLDETGYRIVAEEIFRELTQRNLLEDAKAEHND